MKQFLAYLFFCFTLHGQNDSTFLRLIHDEALVKGHAHHNLRSLCKDVGSRLSGSASAEMAVVWSENKMKSYGFDKVYLQEIMVPHWERGTQEGAWSRDEKGNIRKLNILALGGSISTNGKLNASIVEFSSLAQLKEASPAQIKGKIVFLNEPMSQAFIQTFKAYGACYPIRGDGAVEASKKGAVAIVIRSLAIPLDDFPHTGSMRYDESVAKIPAAALSTNDCEWLSKELKSGKMTLTMEMNCQNFPDIKSYNIICEMTGTEKPKDIITFGGHIDSWDAGEGAHDDGAGVIHNLEAIRILQSLKYKPKHTLRCVFFMNEENGNKGGLTYASWAKERGENQIAAIESDRGGFSPRGFDVDGNDEQLQLLRSFNTLFKPYDLLHFEKGFGGVDITPLKNVYEGIPLFGLVTDSQRYFDFHHAESDVFENVNKRELELGAAAVASLVYLLDKNL
ncbi:MAG: M20/M25/M40 family metallo-hydrolase [Bacteroidetes bacterium]|nr:M20/M25/M40 family metallo-hydrolase [Bacteroidota bacterium]